MGVKPQLGHGEQTLRWKAGPKSFQPLCRTAVYVIRMYGGVGGEEPRGFPLSRFGARPEVSSLIRGQEAPMLVNGICDIRGGDRWS